ncbi:MAG: hypothetical protein R2713_13030 [Ilumatobacteraceae bacterium]
MHVTPAPATTRPPAADRRRRRPSRRELAAIVLGLTTLASALVITADVDAPVADADGNPNITFTKTADTRTLIGATTAVSLRACNPTGTDGYNLSFRDVIPAGLSMVNANPAPTRTVANQPNAGETTVIWENVSDLLGGSCTSIGYGIDTNPDNNLSTNQVGSSFATSGGAYVSDVAFDVPDFDVNGQPTGTHNDGYATGTSAGTTIAAFIAEKDSGDAGEGELLRGARQRTEDLHAPGAQQSRSRHQRVHDHRRPAAVARVPRLRMSASARMRPAATTPPTRPPIRAAASRSTRDRAGWRRARSPRPASRRRRSPPSPAARRRWWDSASSAVRRTSPRTRSSRSPTSPASRCARTPTPGPAPPRRPRASARAATSTTTRAPRRRSRPPRATSPTASRRPACSRVRPPRAPTRSSPTRPSRPTPRRTSSSASR